MTDTDRCPHPGHVAIWRTTTGPTLLCRECLDRYWDFAQAYPVNRPLTIDALPYRRVVVCRCEHPRDAHTHLRRGTDCALCGCRRWRRHWWLLAYDTWTWLRRLVKGANR